jgi:hypothetical protein
MILNAESAEHAPRKYVFIVHVFMLLILLRIKTIVPLAIEAHKMATIMGRKVQAAWPMEEYFSVIEEFVAIEATSNRNGGRATQMTPRKAMTAQLKSTGSKGSRKKQAPYNRACWFSILAMPLILPRKTLGRA